MPASTLASSSPRPHNQRSLLGLVRGDACRTVPVYRRIGPYRILQQIGSGGSSVVYKAYDENLRRTVAIKLCTDSSPQSHRAFRQEAEIGGLLDHPAFPMLYDADFHEQQPFLVQEYLRGESLFHLICRREPHNLVEKLDILIQIVRGLRYAHSLGITHGDVKPGNIQVLESGRVKILDFGAAHLDQVEATETEAGMVVGTPAYLAPEKLKGLPPSASSDIFSFGVLAYELVAFRAPFVGSTILSTLDQLLNKEPTPLTRLGPHCPVALAELIQTCLEKDPGDRQMSFKVLQHDLSRIQAEQLATLEVGCKAGLDPGLQASALIERAQQRHQLGMFRQAFLLLREALALVPDHPQAQQFLADLVTDGQSPSSMLHRMAA